MGRGILQWICLIAEPQLRRRPRPDAPMATDWLGFGVVHVRFTITRPASQKRTQPQTSLVLGLVSAETTHTPRREATRGCGIVAATWPRRSRWITAYLATAHEGNHSRQPRCDTVQKLPTSNTSAILAPPFCFAQNSQIKFCLAGVCSGTSISTRPGPFPALLGWSWS